MVARYFPCKKSETVVLPHNSRESCFFVFWQGWPGGISWSLSLSAGLRQQSGGFKFDITIFS